jgi:hypothetical protein
MDWRGLDLPTKAAVVATAMAVLGALVPPLGVASAVVGAACSAVAVSHARRRGERNRVALICLVVSLAVVVLVVVGNAIYASRE